MYVSDSADTLIHARVGTADVRPTTPSLSPLARAASHDIALSVYGNLDAIEAEWRAFEQVADCTVFQTFDWHKAWHKHIGEPAGILPAIVVGRRGDQLAFIIPFAIARGRLARGLVWHGCDLCDYNAPLLAPDLAGTLTRERFLAVFDEIKTTLCRDPRTRFDVIILDKMPETVGGQPNPLLALRTSLNPSGAYLTSLGSDWESFYLEKRSSATRRRDRTKRKRLGDIGEVRYLTPADKPAIEEVLSVLVEQKSRAFARMGVPNLFTRPGVRDFFFDFATNARSRKLAHVSRFNVGATLAAANFGLMFRGRYYHILASYDAGEVSRFGPGAAHLHELMRHAIEHGCTEFDFTIGDEPYKRDWSDHEMKLYDHRSAVTAIGAVAARISTARARVKRVIKQAPVLWRLVTKARALLGAVMHRGRAPAVVVTGAEESDA